MPNTTQTVRALQTMVSLVNANSSNATVPVATLNGHHVRHSRHHQSELKIPLANHREGNANKKHNNSSVRSHKNESRYNLTSNRHHRQRVAHQGNRGHNVTADKPTVTRSQSQVKTPGINVQAAISRPTVKPQDPVTKGAGATTKTNHHKKLVTSVPQPVTNRMALDRPATGSFQANHHSPAVTGASAITKQNRGHNQKPSTDVAQQDNYRTAIDRKRAKRTAAPGQPQAAFSPDDKAPTRRQKNREEGRKRHKVKKNNRHRGGKKATAAIQPRRPENTRLVPCGSNPPGTVSGTLETRYQGTWVRISRRSFNFDNKAASVACRDMGYPAESARFHWTTPRACAGTGPILTKVHCTGEENSMQDCRLDGLHRDSANAAVDARISCQLVRFAELSDCVHGDPGHPVTTGIPQLWSKDLGQWAAVDSKGLDNRVAQAACESVGHTGGEIKEAVSCPGIDMMAWSNVTCDRDETNILNCSRNEPAVDNDSHGKVAVVGCKPRIRLNSMDGCNDLAAPNRVSGRLEVLYENLWQPVCSQTFDYHDARVACRELGYPGDSALFRKASWRCQLDDTIYRGRLEYLQCTGEEKRLTHCFDYDFSSCLNIRNGVLVSCGKDIRLVPPPDYCLFDIPPADRVRGRLEFNHNGQWGTVCDDYFDHHAASVSCRNLGYRGDGAWFQRSSGNCGYSSGKGPIMLDNVKCTGKEKRLSECQYLLLSGNCRQDEAIHLTCLLPDQTTPATTTRRAIISSLQAITPSEVVLAPLIGLAQPQNGTLTPASLRSTEESGQRASLLWMGGAVCVAGMALFRFRCCIR